MKLSKIFFSSFLITAVVSIFAPSIAAANCSQSDPCSTWAVVDSNGTVVNSIVCQSSVCGSGTFGGMKVVQQALPTETGQPSNGSDGKGANFSDPVNNKTVSVDNSGIFTVKVVTQNPNVISTETVVEQSTKENGNTVTTTTEIKVETENNTVTTETFTKENPRPVVVSVDEVEQTSNAEITVTETVIETDENIVVNTSSDTENHIFTERSTKETVRSEVENKPVIRKNIERIFLHLDRWMLIAV